MTAAALILAVWLMPAAWLELAALIAERGSDGLWIGLALTLAPLLALGANSGARSPAEGRREPLFPVVVLLLGVGLLLWAQIVLAGDVAVSLGAPRWVGIALTAASGWLLAAWRSARRLVPVLLVSSLVAASLPLAERARLAGMDPLRAWQRVASEPAFLLPASSPWTTSGGVLRLGRGRAALAFDEEHRLTAPAGGRLHARTVDGRRVADVEWELGPGQSITLRPGDRLRPMSELRLRFEAGKRVPGAPASGVAWAAGRAPAWPEVVGLLVTVLLGAVALLRSGVAAETSRSGVTLVGGGVLAAFLWAQGWAVYAVLGAPDLLLGGVSAERLLSVRGFALRDSAWGGPLEIVLLAGAFAAFLASSVALRERLGALDRSGGGEIGRDLGLWAAVFGVAGAAGMWPADPWALMLLALGSLASSLGPATLRPAAESGSRAETAAGLVGLVLFAGLALAGQARGPTPGLAGAVLAYPALAAAPAGAAVLWLARGARRR